MSVALFLGTSAKGTGQVMLEEIWPSRCSTWVCSLATEKLGFDVGMKHKQMG